VRFKGLSQGTTSPAVAMARRIAKLTPLDGHLIRR